MPIGKDDTGIWDQTIHFGVGRKKGNHHTGFHSIEREDPKGEVFKEGVFTGFVWRGDARAPDEIFDHGFKVNASGEKISNRVTSSIAGISAKGPTRGIISTTEVMSLAANWAAVNAHKDPDTQGWVYLIGVENDPGVASAYVNAGNHKGAMSAANNQAELMFRQIKPTSIKSARKVKYVKDKLGFQNAVLTGEVVENPNYQGPRLSKETIENDFSMTKFMKPGSDISPMPCNDDERKQYLEQEQRIESNQISFALRAKKTTPPPVRKKTFMSFLTSSGSSVAKSSQPKSNQQTRKIEKVDDQDASSQSDKTSETDSRSNSRKPC